MLQRGPNSGFKCCESREVDCLWPEIHSGVGDCAKSISTKACTSSPSQERSVGGTATMLPLWQSRPYRNFLQVQRSQVQPLQITGHLEAVFRKKAPSKA